MDFAFTDEQEQLRAVARGWLADALPLDRVAALVDGPEGWDPSVWRTLAELGWLDPVMGPLELAVLFEEAAAALLPAPFFATVALAVPALEGDPGLRESVAEGSHRLTLAWAEEGHPQTLTAAAELAAGAAAGGRGDAGPPVGAADGGPDDAAVVDGAGRVAGRKVLVPDAGLVDGFVVVARMQDGAPTLRLVDAGDADVRVASTMDTTRRLGVVAFDGAPSTGLAEGEAAVAALRAVRVRARSAAACEAVGVARRALDLAADHARTREQFGRVIGAYQGVSHRVADGYARVELARSLATWAAWCVADDPQRAPVAVAAAASGAADAAVWVCEAAIQVLGGMGFTWEHPLHRLYKRALWLQSFDGGARSQRQEVAAALLDA